MCGTVNAVVERGLVKRLLEATSLERLDPEGPGSIKIMSKIVPGKFPVH